jgi:hypothetical protein
LRHPVHRQELLNVRMRRFLQIRHRSEGDGVAFKQHYHGVGDLAHQSQIMRDHHAGELQLPLQPEHQVADGIGEMMDSFCLETEKSISHAVGK